jgi:cell wall assembly regulator SMI1
VVVRRRLRLRLVTAPSSLTEAFAEFRAALQKKLPELVHELRPPIVFDADYLGRRGAEQLRELWSLTSGQADSGLGVAGGLRVLGPVDSEVERAKWTNLFTTGIGFDAVARPTWDMSESLHPDAVRSVYYAAGWIPVFCEPMEGNYLAVDLVPLEAGHPGQIILCGRDEDQKCVIAPDLASVFRALAEECREGLWEVREGVSGDKKKKFFYMYREGGRLLTEWRTRLLP